MARVQGEIKRQADRERKKAEEWKVGDRVILRQKIWYSRKDWTKKLVDWYVGLYTIDKVISTNVVKLQLPILMRIEC